MLSLRTKFSVFNGNSMRKILNKKISGKRDTPKIYVHETALFQTYIHCTDKIVLKELVDTLYIRKFA